MQHASKNPQHPVDTGDTAFKRVVGYFLDHEKPPAAPKKKPRKAARKKPSTKAKKRTKG